MIISIMAEPIEYLVQRIKVIGFEPKQPTITFKVEFTKNGQPGSVTQRYDFEDPSFFIRSVIHEIKQKEPLHVWDNDDILAGYQVVVLKDQEGTEERLLHFIQRMNERFKLMKKMKDAGKYMQLFDEMKVAKMELM
mgnify:FL=1